MITVTHGTDEREACLTDLTGQYHRLPRYGGHVGLETAENDIHTIETGHNGRHRMDAYLNRFFSASRTPKSGEIVICTVVSEDLNPGSGKSKREYTWRIKE